MEILRYTGLNNGAGDELWLIDCARLNFFPESVNGVINFNVLTSQISNYSEEDDILKIKFRHNDLKYKILTESYNGDDLESIVVEGRRPHDDLQIVEMFRSFISKEFVAIFFTYNTSGDSRISLIFGNKNCGCIFKPIERNSGESFSDGSRNTFAIINKQKIASYFLDIS